MLARISSVTQQAATETRRAIEAGIMLLRSEGQPATFPESLSAIVWRLLQEAADILARLPDQERVWLLAADRVAWPEIMHTYQERLEEENQRLAERRNAERAGFTPEQTPLIRRNVTDPGAVSRMLTVLGWLQHVRARTPRRVKRDKMVVLALAQGQPIKSVRRLMLNDTSDYAILAVKRKVIKQICAALNRTPNQG